MSLFSTAYRSVARRIKSTPLWPTLRPRRTHTFCVGAPRTGTHSIATGLRARTVHEPAAGAIIALAARRQTGAVSSGAVRRFLRRHDREWRAEVISSHPHGEFVRALVALFPSARFLLTLRAPKAWLASALNHIVNHPMTAPEMACWRRIRRLYYGPPGPVEERPVEERVLARNGLPSLRGMLRFYERRTVTVLDRVPPERLMVVRTRSISQRIRRVAAFVGVAPSPSRRRAHTGRARTYHDVLGPVSSGYVDALIARHAPESARLVATLD